jgi:hypothetical protein
LEHYSGVLIISKFYILHIPRARESVLGSSFLLDLYASVYYKYNNSEALPVIGRLLIGHQKPIHLAALFTVDQAQKITLCQLSGFRFK